MGKYNINANLRATEHLYNIAIRAAQMNDSHGEWFRTKVVFRKEQRCYPAFFSVLLLLLFFLSFFQEGLWQN